MSLFFCCTLSIGAAQAISLYTPYTKISVPPGESIDYGIDIINNSSVIRNAEIIVWGMPKDWEYSVKSGGWSVEQISILPGEKKTINLKVDVPLKVDKGNHRFTVVAKNLAQLPLTINVSEQGTFKTEFTSDQANMQGHAKSNFNFTTKLKNMTGEKQLYALQANPERGWQVVFKPNYNQATAVEIEPNNTSNISVEVKPPFNVAAGTYKIPIRAINNATSAEQELEVVITGTFEMELSTAQGVLSTSLTAGRERKMELLIKNTGSSSLENIRLSATKPQNWEISFSPDTVKSLEVGKNVIVQANIKAYDKAIPGDYVANITAQTPEASATAALRVSVKTPMLWGWLGILIIAGAIGFIYYLFKKYGRR
ncbi:MAG: NEW3 domain-containing protein [Cyclobacteriaceae bacterium]